MAFIRQYWYHLLAVITVIIWGTTFVSTKVLINEGLGAVDIFIYRFVLAYVSIWLFSPRKLWAGNIRDELILLAAGVFGGSLYFLTENLAIGYSTPTNVSLIVCTTPIFTTIVLGFFYKDERMKKKQFWGSLIAFVGMTLVILNGQFVLKLSPKGDLLALTAALSWAFYSLIIKQLGSQHTTVFITRKIFFYGTLTILPLLLKEPLTMDTSVLFRPLVWINILFLGIAASLFCYILWNVTINKLGIIRSTNYIYLIPLVTMITSAISINEKITLYAGLGALLILLGLYLVEKTRSNT
jgi:drug/metabolite transporter (DMT)-like permease